MSILVVDDEPDICGFMQDILEYEGFSVSCASHGQQALDLLHQVRPALVICDMFLPDMSGMTLYDRIKANPSTADIPVILMTAFPRGAGPPPPVEILYKPFDIKDLVSRVKNACREAVPPQPLET